MVNGVPCHTPLLMVPTSVMSKAFISALLWSELVTFAVLASISAKRVLANLSSVIWSSPI